MPNIILNTSCLLRIKFTAFSVIIKQKSNSLYYYKIH